VLRATAGERVKERSVGRDPTHRAGVRRSRRTNHALTSAIANTSTTLAQRAMRATKYAALSAIGSVTPAPSQIDPPSKSAQSSNDCPAIARSAISIPASKTNDTATTRSTNTPSERGSTRLMGGRRRGAVRTASNAASSRRRAAPATTASAVHEMTARDACAMWS